MARSLIAVALRYATLCIAFGVFCSTAAAYRPHDPGCRTRACDHRVDEAWAYWEAWVSEPGHPYASNPPKGWEPARATKATSEPTQAETACHIEQSGPENGVIHATGLAPLGHNKLYDVLVLGPAKQNVNSYVLFPGEESPLFFNTRFGAGTYEGQVWEAHRINKAKESPPAVERDKELSSCSASLT